MSRAMRGGSDRVVGASQPTRLTQAGVLPRGGSLSAVRYIIMWVWRGLNLVILVRVVACRCVFECVAR